MVAGYFGTACERTGGDTTPQYLWSESRSGRAFLVIARVGDDVLAGSIWRFEEWTSGRKMKCLVIGGRHMEIWKDPHREFVENMGRTGGAKTIVTEGREGWQRVFPDAKVIRQVYEVEI